jgi:hypothetical protein
MINADVIAAFHSEFEKKGRLNRQFKMRLKFAVDLVNDYFLTKYRQGFLLRMLDTEGKSKELFLTIVEVFITSANKMFDSLKEIASEN